jgi:hypothetical protein
MLVRERRMAEAVETARTIAIAFPENEDIAKFIEKQAQPAAP